MEPSKKFIDVAVHQQSAFYNLALLVFLRSPSHKKNGSCVNVSGSFWTDTVTNALRASRSLNYRYLQGIKKRK